MPNGIATIIHLLVLDTGVIAGHPIFQCIPLAYAYSFVQGSPFEDDVGHGSQLMDLALALSTPLQDVLRLSIGRVIGTSGTGYPQDLADVLDWAAGVEPDVMVLPLGLRCNHSSIAGGVEKLLRLGARLFAAVGNPAVEMRRPLYPAAYPGVVAVGVTRYTAFYADWKRQPDILVDDDALGLPAELTCLGTSAAALQAALAACQLPMVNTHSWNPGTACGPSPDWFAVD